MQTTTNVWWGYDCQKCKRFWSWLVKYNSQMGKHSVVDDKMPLTHTRSNIIHETRARFDSLLNAALDQGRDNAGQLHENHDNVIIYDII
jgi:arsenate reductase-like glutaredoxin family protein